jgi:hypothetical protein
MGIRIGSMFRDVMLGAGQQTIDTWGIQAEQDRIQTQSGITEAVGQYNETLRNNDQANQNYNQLLKFVKARPDAFGGNWDKRLAGLYQDNVSLFMGDDFDVVKDRVGKELATYKLDIERLQTDTENPYVPQAEYFKLNQERIRGQIGNISGMNNVMNLMTAEQEFAEGKMAIPKETERFDMQMSTAFMTAYGYGLLRQDPASEANARLHEIEKLRIISSNAQKFTDANEKGKFISDAINKNAIDLTTLYAFKKPVQAGILVKAFETHLRTEVDIVDKALVRLTALQADPDTPPEQIEAARDAYQTAFGNMMGKINNWTAGQLHFMPFDVGEVAKKEEAIEPTPELVIPEGYEPQINARGQITLIDGTRVSIEDILADVETYSKTQPPEVIEYVNKFAQFFDENNQMIEPTRDMFPKGKKGDKLFKQLTRMYMALTPENFIEVMPGAWVKRTESPSVIEKIKETFKKLQPEKLKVEELEKITTKK